WWQLRCRSGHRPSIAAHRATGADVAGAIEVHQAPTSRTMEHRVAYASAQGRTGSIPKQPGELSTQENTACPRSDSNLDLPRAPGHYPLSHGDTEILGKEDSSDPLLLLQSAADFLKRPIILIGETNSWSIIPQELEGNVGILLCWGNPIIPVVFGSEQRPQLYHLDQDDELHTLHEPNQLYQLYQRYQQYQVYPRDQLYKHNDWCLLNRLDQDYAPWMTVNRLPPLYGNRQIPASLRKAGRISFRESVTVAWEIHTCPLLWALDRHLAGLPPLTADELEERKDRLLE
ncbi:unnamed protein product, partial [Darwinula stevensoni]